MRTKGLVEVLMHKPHAPALITMITPTNFDSTYFCNHTPTVTLTTLFTQQNTI